MKNPLRRYVSAKILNTKCNIICISNVKIQPINSTLVTPNTKHLNVHRYTDELPLTKESMIKSIGQALTKKLLLDDTEDSSTEWNLEHELWDTVI